MKLSNKYIPYGKQSIDKKDIASVISVLESDFITQGPKVKEFEDKIASYCGAKYAVVVSSGTAALHMACLAAGIRQQNEVITTPISFVASTNCILYCGGKPIFADIQRDTMNIDPEEIEKNLTKETAAIILVHFAGHPCDLEEINAIAKERNLIVIEDAAHALGAEYRGLKIGSCKYSDMTTFSFHPIKSITTGEGGAVLTNKKRLYENLMVLRNHGIIKRHSRFQIRNSNLTGPWYYEMQELGFNYRVTDFQCALGINQLKKLNRLLERRREIAQIYNTELSKINAIELPCEKEYIKSAWHLYIIRIKDKRSRIDNAFPNIKRNRIFNILRKKGIGVQVHYIPIHLHPYYRKKFGFKEGDYRKAEEYYRNAITLPLYPQMSISDIEYIIDILKKNL